MPTQETCESYGLLGHFAYDLAPNSNLASLDVLFNTLVTVLFATLWIDAQKISMFSIFTTPCTAPLTKTVDVYDHSGSEKRSNVVRNLVGQRQIGRPTTASHVGILQCRERILLVQPFMCKLINRFSGLKRVFPTTRDVRRESILAPRTPKHKC